MEQRIIPLKIAGERVIGAGVTVGAVGSHDEVLLEMDFRPSGLWKGTTRRAIFSNALGEERTVIILTTDLLAEGQSEVYLVPVPQQAKSVAGECFLTVEGFVAQGEKEVVRCVTEEARFRVLPSKLYYNDTQPVTPTQAEQLQAEIDSIKTDIVEARKAVAAEETRELAEAARRAAEETRERAEAEREYQEDHRQRDETLRCDAETARAAEELLRVAAEEAREAAERSRADEHTGLVAQATRLKDETVAQVGQLKEEATAQAERAAREADRAKQAAGAEFLTAVDMEDQLAEHLRIGEAELMKTMPVGGALFVTDGELPEGLVPEGDIEKSWEESY